MPVMLQVGWSRKLSRPRNGPLSARCAVTIELAAELWSCDPDLFRAQVQEAFRACQTAVAAEIAHRAQELSVARERAVVVLGEACVVGPVAAVPDPATKADPGAGRVDGMSSGGAAERNTSAPSRTDSLAAATGQQLRAIQAFARGHQLDPAWLAYRRFGTYAWSELSIREASDLIDELQSGNG